MPRRALKKPPDWEHAREAFFAHEPRPLIGMEVRCAWCKDEPLPCTACWHHSWQLRPMIRGTFEVVKSDGYTQHIPFAEEAA